MGEKCSVYCIMCHLYDDVLLVSQDIILLSNDIICPVRREKKSVKMETMETEKTA